MTEHDVERGRLLPVAVAADLGQGVRPLVAISPADGDAHPVGGEGLGVRRQLIGLGLVVVQLVGQAVHERPEPDALHLAVDGQDLASHGDRHDAVGAAIG